MRGRRNDPHQDERVGCHRSLTPTALPPLGAPWRPARASAAAVRERRAEARRCVRTIGGKRGGKARRGGPSQKAR
eukprot:1704893-Pyramimonas_sp.AAC.1